MAWACYRESQYGVRSGSTGWLTWIIERQDRIGLLGRPRENPLSAQFSLSDISIVVAV